LIHTLLLTDDRHVLSWGMGGHCQTGHPEPKYYLLPRVIEKLADEGGVVQISAGTYQSTAILDTGEVYIWGSFLLGALGFGDVHRPQVKPKVLGSLLHRRNAQAQCGNHYILIR